jgi:hypothetical protein
MRVASFPRLRLGATGWDRRSDNRKFPFALNRQVRGICQNEWENRSTNSFLLSCVYLLLLVNGSGVVEGDVQSFSGNWTPLGAKGGVIDR